MHKIFLFGFVVILLLSQPTHAWVYPEHRNIAILAIEKLSEADRAALEKIWSEARTNYDGRLTPLVIDTAQGRNPGKLDYAAWFGIAGDHSCSPADMLNSVLNTEWIMKVADVAARLEDGLSKAEKNDQLVNALRNSDIRLQRADIAYATRAGANNVHFLLARKDITVDSNEYFSESLRQGSDLNAIGAYSWFHSLALAKAQKYSELSGDGKYAMILAALADEAFALHFLEDIYSAGHVAGTWGNASMRKGTHDYYNEKGLETVTWNGQRLILLGDAYMKNENAEIASKTILLSLEQLIHAAEGKLKSGNAESLMNAPDTFDVCKNNFMPLGKYDFELLRGIYRTLPVPCLASGHGSVPRFRAEIGPFLGTAASVSASTINGGFGESQKSAGAIGSLEANFRIGYGLDGVLDKSGDGLVFLQLGWRMDSPTTSQFTNEDSNFPTNTITSTIPGRSAYNIRLRMPFWLIPGDLIIAAPLLGLTSPKTFQKMAVAAGNGGLIPWQSGIATGIGRFQFVLGREAGLSLYGSGNTSDGLIIPQEEKKAYLVQYKSAKLDFPFLEYRPFTYFSQDQGSSMLIQFCFGTDIPFDEHVLLPVGDPSVKLKSIWYIEMRVVFGWRHYL